MKSFLRTKQPKPNKVKKPLKERSKKSVFTDDTSNNEIKVSVFPFPNNIVRAYNSIEDNIMEINDTSEIDNSAGKNIIYNKICEVLKTNYKNACKHTNYIIKMEFPNTYYKDYILISSLFKYINVNISSINEYKCEIILSGSIYGFRYIINNIECQNNNKIYRFILNALYLSDSVFFKDFIEHGIMDELLFGNCGLDFIYNNKLYNKIEDIDNITIMDNDIIKDSISFKSLCEIYKNDINKVLDNGTISIVTDNDVFGNMTTSKYEDDGTCKYVYTDTYSNLIKSNIITEYTENLNKYISKITGIPEKSFDIISNNPKAKVRAALYNSDFDPEIDEIIE